MPPRARASAAFASIRRLVPPGELQKAASAVNLDSSPKAGLSFGRHDPGLVARKCLLISAAMVTRPAELTPDFRRIGTVRRAMGLSEDLLQTFDRLGIPADALEGPGKVDRQRPRLNALGPLPVAPIDKFERGFEMVNRLLIRVPFEGSASRDEEILNRLSTRCMIA